MYNTQHPQHLKDRGVERYGEDGAIDKAIEQGRTTGLHKDEAIDTHSYIQAYYKPNKEKNICQK